MSDYGIRTYADLAETCCGHGVANEIASPPAGACERGLGTLGRDIPVVHRPGPSFLMEHTDEPVFYDAELGLYVWGDNPLRKCVVDCARAGNPLTHRKGSSITLLPYLFRLLVLLVRIGPVFHAATGTPCRLVLAFLQAHALCLLLALVLVGKGLLG